MASNSASLSASTSFPEQFQPRSSFKFPKKKYGKYERSFRAEWCQQNSWLHYDDSLDAAFCYLCMRAEHEGKFLVSTKREPSFLSKGYTNWKEATSTFKKHQTSACHLEALEAVVTLPKQIIGEIDEVLCKENKEVKAVNRKMLLTVFENIKFLARRTEGNFNQLLLLRSLDRPEILAWMNKKTNKYTSHNIQNEHLQIIENKIIREVSRNIRESNCFTIMADECSDIANKEQFTICIRWVDDDLQDNEDFVGLYEINSIDSDTLVHAIKDTILRIALSLSQCRGQCYDGASNISGIRIGVSAKILSEE